MACETNKARAETSLSILTPPSSFFSLSSAPPPTAPPRSNLELFAYTNNKTSWRDKAYNTVELKQAKKALPAAKKMQRAKDKEDERRKSSLKNKGFSMRGAGML